MFLSDKSGTPVRIARRRSSHSSTSPRLLPTNFSRVPGPRVPTLRAVPILERAPADVPLSAQRLLRGARWAAHRQVSIHQSAARAEASFPRQVSYLRDSARGSPGVLAAHSPIESAPNQGVQRSTRLARMSKIDDRSPRRRSPAPSALTSSGCRRVLASEPRREICWYTSRPPERPSMREVVGPASAFPARGRATSRGGAALCPYLSALTSVVLLRTASRIRALSKSAGQSCGSGP